MALQVWKPHCMRYIVLLLMVCFAHAASAAPPTPSPTPPGYPATGRQGTAWRAAPYRPSQLPTFEASKGLLPEPIIDEPRFVALYWKAWTLAFAHLKSPPSGSPLPSAFADEGFAPQIFQWDTIFMLTFWRYGHHVFPAIHSLDNFYARQHANGFICREIREGDGGDFYYEGFQNALNPPIFACAEVAWARASGDTSRYAEVLPTLERYAAWIERWRKGPRDGLFWQTGLGSGMDNVPRPNPTADGPPAGWVDLSAQMAAAYDAMALMHETLGHAQDAARLRERVRQIQDAVAATMWNERDGVYYDVRGDVQQNCKSIACFWPLWAGMSSSAQAARMVAELRNPASFWRLDPFPSLAADQPQYRPQGDYWLGSVWAPTNVMATDALVRSGHPGLAAEATRRYLTAMAAVFEETGTIWENYRPDAAQRGSWSKPDFVGWSGCGPITMLIEDLIGIRPYDRDDRIVWNIVRTDRHGVRNLHVRGATVSLICSPRASAAVPAHIEVESDRAVLLDLRDGARRLVQSVAAGRTVLEVR